MKKSDRALIYNKYGGRCAYCGCELAERWHVDHLEPVVRLSKWCQNAGRFKPTGEMVNPERDCFENYMPSCPSCNVAKHASTLEGFRIYLGKLLTIINRDNNNYRLAKRYGQINEIIEPVVFYFEKFNTI